MKKILFPLLSLFLGYLTTGLMQNLIVSEPGQLSAGGTFFLSFLSTLYITGVFAFIGFAYPTNRLLPDGYYQIKNPKALSQIGKVMGVEYFRFLLLITFWGMKKNRKKYFNGTKQGLRNFIFQTKQSEFGHIGAFVVILVVSIVLLLHGYISMVIIITGINIIGNVYPVILQRLHRMRIEKVMKINKP